MEKKIVTMMNRIEAMQKVVLEMVEKLDPSPNSDLQKAKSSLMDAAFEMNEVYRNLNDSADHLENKRLKMKPWKRGQ